MKDVKHIIQEKYPDLKITADMEKAIKHFMEFAPDGGFPFAKIDANYGKQTRVTGNAVEALFTFRALAYGLNVAKSEVTGCDYDVIVEYNKIVNRVQIKSISKDPANISLKDRDRGGQGIDQHHESNKGKPFTSERADIIAFVEKQTGLCYIVPLIWIEAQSSLLLHRDQRDTFKENWNVFIN